MTWAGLVLPVRLVAAPPPATGAVRSGAQAEVVRARYALVRAVQLSAALQQVLA